jgi:hypothetical protein
MLALSRQSVIRSGLRSAWVVGLLFIVVTVIGAVPSMGNFLPGSRAASPAEAMLAQTALPARARSWAPLIVVYAASAG